MTKRAIGSRRTFLKTGLAATAAAAAPGRLTAQSAPPAAKTIRAVMHGDLTVLDPIWTTANMSAYHGAMLYDTLFGIDANLETKPQMVSKWGPSDDKKTWTFELRDGLKFSDGTAVTADDVIASLRRWAARDGAGQHMMQRVSDIAKKDDKTFQFILKEPYGYLVDALGKTSTPLC
jgi:peptide/nickel transport system substrate-binding protein